MKNQNQQPTPTSQEQTDAKAEVIKLGIDIHKRQYVVVQQVDGEAPKSPLEVYTGSVPTAGS